MEEITEQRSQLLGPFFFFPKAFPSQREEKQAASVKAKTFCKQQILPLKD